MESFFAETAAETARSLAELEPESGAAVAERAGGTVVYMGPGMYLNRAFALGVSAVTIYSSSVTVVAPSETWGALQAKVEDTLTNLFIFYREGALPPPATPAVAPAEEPTETPA